MCLEDVDGLDIVFRTENSLLLDDINGTDDQISKEDGISIDQLAGHGGLSAV